MTKSLITTFWALIIVFIIILCQFFIPVIGELIRGFPLFLMPFALFSFLGVLLVFLTFKQKVVGKLKIYLLLTGVSAVSFFLFVILHNVFYALAEISENIIILKYIMNFFEVIFFLTAIIVCPLIFLIGSIKIILSFIKKDNFRKVEK